MAAKTDIMSLPEGIIRIVVTDVSCCDWKVKIDDSGSEALIIEDQGALFTSELVGRSDDDALDDDRGAFGLAAQALQRYLGEHYREMAIVYQPHAGSREFMRRTVIAMGFVIGEP